MSDYDHTAQPGDPLPGPDPRMSKEYTQSLLNPNKDPRVMHTQPKQEFDMTATEIPSGPTLTNLIDRLEHVYSLAAGLHGDITGINDKLAGSIPQDDKATPTSDKPESLLAYAHDLVSDIDRRLHKINGEFKRLHTNIGS